MDTSMKMPRPKKWASRTISPMLLMVSVSRATTRSTTVVPIRNLTATSRKEMPMISIAMRKSVSAIDNLQVFFKFPNDPGAVCFGILPFDIHTVDIELISPDIDGEGTGGQGDGVGQDKPCHPALQGGARPDDPRVDGQRGTQYLGRHIQVGFYQFA